MNRLLSSPRHRFGHRAAALTRARVTKAIVKTTR